MRKDLWADTVKILINIPGRFIKFNWWQYIDQLDDDIAYNHQNLQVKFLNKERMAFR
jgi:hypothetical protein